ncbi:acetolactate decarboxylase [Herbiconiux sp. 11R-BC]|uniref:acetolactate decarboxylase n=1 Tax=Herbiconiux sp. 11R-BC TaxID=3111637 RepID=UPI003C0F7F2F
MSRIHGMNHRAEKVITQFSTVDALVAGLFDGEFAVRQIAAAGTLGLGCGDHMDGEMVLVDGVFRLFHGDGRMTALEPDDALAFAEVADFTPETSAPLEAAPSLAAIVDELHSRVHTANLFQALRFDGRFGSVSLREAKRQTKPYLPLAEAVRDQRENVVTDVTGTLIGFFAPRVFQGISVAGVHVHFVDETGLIGGHVLEVTDATGELAVESYAGVTVRLPTSPGYLAARLDELDSAASDAAIRHAEADHQR